MPGMIDAHGRRSLGRRSRFEGSDGNEMTVITPHLRALDAINPMRKVLPSSASWGNGHVYLPGSANVVGGQGVVVHLHGNTVEEMIAKEDGGLKIPSARTQAGVFGAERHLDQNGHCRYFARNLVPKLSGEMEKAKTDPTST